MPSRKLAELSKAFLFIEGAYCILKGDIWLIRPIVEMEQLIFDLNPVQKQFRVLKTKQ